MWCGTREWDCNYLPPSPVQVRTAWSGNWANLSRILPRFLVPNLDGGGLWASQLTIRSRSQSQVMCTSSLNASTLKVHTHTHCKVSQCREKSAKASLKAITLGSHLFDLHRLQFERNILSSPLCAWGEMLFYFNWVLTLSATLPVMPVTNIYPVTPQSHFYSASSVWMICLEVTHTHYIYI